MSWQLRVSSPLASAIVAQLDEFGEEQILTGSFSTDIAVGFNSLQVTLASGLGDAVPAGAHIELLCDGTLGWEGQRRRPSLRGYDLDKLECSGYGVTLVDANVMQTAALAIPQNPTAEQQYPAHSVLLNALALAPLLSRGTVWAQPILYQPLSLYDGKTLEEVAKQLGTACGNDFVVWEGRRASWIPRQVPQTPDYYHAIEDCPAWEIDDQGLWTRVSVSYTDAFTGEKAVLGPFTDDEAERLQGVSRHKRLSGGTITQSYANFLAYSFLALNNTPPVRATLGPLANFKDSLGGGVPFYMVRATQWAQIGGAAEGRPEQVIVSTAVDIKKNVVTAQLGAPLFDQIGRVVELQRVTNASKAGVNPNTYAAI